jgi:hypothetical protein
MFDQNKNPHMVCFFFVSTVTVWSHFASLKSLLAFVCLSIKQKRTFKVFSMSYQAIMPSFPAVELPVFSDDGHNAMMTLDAPLPVFSNGDQMAMMEVGGPPNVHSLTEAEPSFNSDITQAPSFQNNQPTPLPTAITPEPTQAPKESTVSVTLPTPDDSTIATTQTPPTTPPREVSDPTSAPGAPKKRKRGNSEALPLLFHDKPIRSASGRPVRSSRYAIPKCYYGRVIRCQKYPDGVYISKNGKPIISDRFKMPKLKKIKVIAKDQWLSLRKSEREEQRDLLYDERVKTDLDSDDVKDLIDDDLTDFEEDEDDEEEEEDSVDNFSDDESELDEDLLGDDDDDDDIISDDDEDSSIVNSTNQ